MSELRSADGLLDDAADQYMQSEARDTLQLEIHFHNIDLGDFSILDRLISDCMREMLEKRRDWIRVTQPIIYDLEEICSVKGTEENTYVAMIRRLLQTIESIRRQGEEIIDMLFQTHLALGTPLVNELRAENRDSEIVVENHTWICLLWAWVGYTALFKTVTQDLAPLLEDWDNWAWPTPFARAQGLRFVSFLVERRIRKNGVDTMIMAPGAWREALREVAPYAAYWLEYEQ